MSARLVYWLTVAVGAWGGEAPFYQVTRVFPGEAEMDAGDFFLTRPIQFDLSADRLYLLDPGESQVLVFDDAGDYIKRFGGRGETLGSLRFPEAISVARDRVMVADRKSRIQVFDLAGNYLREFEARAHLHGFLNLGDRVFALAENDELEHFFALWSLNGRRLAKFSNEPEAGIDPGLFDMRAMLKARGDRLYALRIHGPQLRVFSASGERLPGKSLQFQPEKDEEYRAVRQLAHHTAFDVVEKWLVTSFMARGHARLNVFDLNGLFHGAFRLELEGIATPEDGVEIGDMRFEGSPEEGLVGWFLVTRPKMTMVKVAFSEGWPANFANFDQGPPSGPE